MTRVFLTCLLSLLAVGAGFYAMFCAGDRYGGDGVLAVAVGVLLLWLVAIASCGVKYGRRAVAVILVAPLAQCGGCLATLLPLSEYFVRDSTLREACSHQMYEIGKALQAYHADHGSFPPAYVADAQGKPLLSWRVLILAYIEENYLHQQLVLTESWDGPNNRELSKFPVSLFRSHYPRPKDSPMTSFVAVTGPGTAWPGAKGSKLADLLGGPANTILLVEIADSDVSWAEPRDLDVRDLIQGKGPQPSSRHFSKGFHALFADGTVRYLDWAKLRGFLGPDGAVKGDPDGFAFEVPSLRNF